MDGHGPGNVSVYTTVPTMHTHRLFTIVHVVHLTLQELSPWSQVFGNLSHREPVVAEAAALLVGDLALLEPSQQARLLGALDVPWRGEAVPAWRGPLLSLAKALQVRAGSSEQEPNKLGAARLARQLLFAVYFKLTTWQKSPPLILPAFEVIAAAAPAAKAMPMEGRPQGGYQPGACTTADHPATLSFIFEGVSILSERRATVLCALSVPQARIDMVLCWLLCQLLAAWEAQARAGAAAPVTAAVNSVLAALAKTIATCINNLDVELVTDAQLQRLLKLSLSLVKLPTVAISAYTCIGALAHKVRPTQAFLPLLVHRRQLLMFRLLSILMC